MKMKVIRDGVVHERTIAYYDTENRRAVPVTDSNEVVVYDVLGNAIIVVVQDKK